MKRKDYLTTGEAAAIFSVDPDTILRWIKSGKIPAIRTPGGHYRIHRDVFLTKMVKDISDHEKTNARNSLPYCWEYNSESGIIQDGCKECIVYKSRASRCYELCNISVPIGHAKLFYSESSDDCPYFKNILQFAS